MNHNNLLKTVNAQTRNSYAKILGFGGGSLFTIAFACVVFFGATGGL